MNHNFLDQIRLRDGGGGGDPRQGLCVMELVSWLAGADDVTDRPAGACAVLTNFAISLNDSAPSARTRNTLTPLAPLLVGSDDSHAQTARADYIRMVLAREVAPLLLRHIDRPDAAALMATVESAEDIKTAAALIGPTLDFSPRSIPLVRVFEALAAGESVGLAEQLLSRLQEITYDAGDSRLRRLVWKKLAAALESALHFGKHGEPSDPQVRARLEALQHHLAERRSDDARRPVSKIWQKLLATGHAASAGKPDPIAA